MKAVRSAVEFLCWLWLLGTTPPDHPEQPDPDMNKKCRSLLEVTWLKWLWTMKLEIALACLALFAFFNLAPYIRRVDDTTAWLDGGWLAFIIVAILTVVAGVILFWVLLRILTEVIDAWVDGDDPAFSLVKDFRDTTPAVRLGMFTALFAVVVLGTCIVTAAAF